MLVFARLMIQQSEGGKKQITHPFCLPLKIIERYYQIIPTWGRVADERKND